MASLSFIVDPMDDDGNDRDRSGTNKKDQAGRRYTSAAHSPAQPSSSLSSQPPTRSISPSVVARRRSSKRLSATATLSLSSTSNPAAAPRRPSSDEMDHHPYAHSSSSSNTPMRPMGGATSPSSIPVKLTPITGRVSRAKKGVPVHVCDTCKPPKTFTRAEHLRRHRLSHETPKYACQYPGCDKAFHRQDLLQRHQQRHEQEGSVASTASGSRGRALSATSSSGTMTSPPVFANTYQPPPTTATSKSPIPGGPLSPQPSTSYGLQHPSTHYQPPPSQYGGEPSQPGQHDSVHASRTATSMPGFNPNTYAAPTPVPASPGPNPFEGRDSGAQPSGTWSSSQSGLYPPTTDYGTVPYAGYYNAGNAPPIGPVPYPYQPGADVIGQQAATYPEYGSITSAGMASPLVVSPAPCASPVGGSIHTSSPHAYATPSPLPAGAPDVAPGSRDGAPMLSWSSANSSASSIPPSTLPATNIPIMVNQIPMEIDMDMEVDAGLLALAVPTMPHPYISGPCFQPAVRSPQLQGAQAAVPQYLDVYWKKVAPRLPIVHPLALSADAELDDIAHAVGTMDVGGASKTEVLKCAMAAVATQFMSDKEAMARGSQLHEWALGEVKTSCELSNVQVMQTIVLCEYFSRFRGRKVVVRPSEKFEWVYRQLLNDMSLHSALRQPPTFASWLRLETRRRLLSACFLLDMHASILHAQTSLTSRFLPPQPTHLPFPLSTYTASLWECADEGTWTNLLNRSTRYLAAATSEPRVLPPPGTMSPDMAAQLSRQPFDECLLTAAEALHLTTPDMSHRPNNISPQSLMVPDSTFLSPGRVTGGMGGRTSISVAQRISTTTALSSAASSVSLSSSLSSQGSLVDDSSDSDNNDEDDGLDGSSNSALEAEICEFESLATRVRSQGLQLVFPNSSTALAYAALRATPLLALLAVSGDSWLFAHKVVHRGSFVGYKRLLRAWASSSACGVAARLAAKALLGLIIPSTGAGDPAEEPWTYEISGYWTVYVCCLILWAYGYRGALGAEGSNNEKSSATASASEGEVFTWLRRVGESAGSEDTNVQMEMMLRSKKLSEELVAAVKKRFDGAGAHKCRLFVDAVRVLSVLGQEKGQRTSWL